MKLIIDIPEEVYKLGTLGLYFDCYSMRLHDTILSGTPIPDNITNGDVIMTMFPNANVYEHNGGATYSVNNEYNFNATWWNAPYYENEE